MFQDPTYQDNSSQGGSQGGYQGARPQRQMFDVSSLNLTCAECNAAITELPFEPRQREDGTYGRLYCYECNKQRMRNRGPRRDFGNRDRY